jgi:hypothetical protein
VSYRGVISVIYSGKITHAVVICVIHISYASYRGHSCLIVCRDDILPVCVIKVLLMV